MKNKPEHLYSPHTDRCNKCGALSSDELIAATICGTGDPDSGYSLEDFTPGEQVNVERWQGDIFNHNFTGTVKEVNAEYVVVVDQDGDCFSVEPEQLTFSSDEVMHGN